MLRNRYILGDFRSTSQNPKQKETKSEVATSPVPSRGPKRGHKCYVTPTFSVVPNTKRGEKIRIPYLTLGFPEEGASATQPLHSQGFPVQIPQSQTKGDKIRSGYLTPAFSGAQKRAQVLCNTCIVGDSQHEARRENPKWLPHPFLLGYKEESGSAT